MSIYLTVALAIYVISAVGIAASFLYNEYKFKDTLAPITYGELIGRMIVAVFPVVNTTIGVWLLADVVGKKLKKVLKKPVFKN